MLTPDQLNTANINADIAKDALNQRERLQDTKNAVEQRATVFNTKISIMSDVREYGEGEPVELWRDGPTGRLMIRAYNECRNNCTDIDLWDLMDWLSAGPGKRLLENIEGPRSPSGGGAGSGG